MMKLNKKLLKSSGAVMALLAMVAVVFGQGIVPPVDPSAPVNPPGQITPVQPLSPEEASRLLDVSGKIKTELLTPLTTKPYVNVTHYGAVPDDAGDDTAAIVAAVVAAKARKAVVYVPAGNYKVSGVAFDLNWEGATLLGDSAGLGGSIITTSSTSLPVVRVAADYNHVRISKVRIVGDGRATSTNNGIELRGDVNDSSGGVGSNIDMLTFSNLTVIGFNKGIDAKGVANSSFDRVAVENCTTSMYLYGNSNSVTFENCAFVCIDGALSGTRGLDIAPSCNGVLVSSCDAGGPTLEWCIWDEGINTSIHGGQWECYGSGMYSINGLTWVGTAVREFGVSSPNRWSLQASTGTIVGVSLGVRDGVTGSSIRSNSTISRNLFVYGNVAEKVDFYTGSAPSGTLQSTAPTAHIPVTTQATGAAATAINHGSSFKRISTGLNDSWYLNVKSAAGNYAWANMFDYHFDKVANGMPAWSGAQNTFSQSQRITSSSNPGLSITTAAYAGGASQSGLFIATANNNVATGAKTGDTVALGKAGGTFWIGINQQTHMGISSSGIADHADNAAALSAGLVVGQIYRTGDVLKIVH